MYLMYTHDGKYATAARSVRKDGKITKTYIHVGKVIDREKGIFDNKDIGITGFDTETGQFVNVQYESLPRPVMKEKLIVDFGDAYVLDRYMHDRRITDCLDEISFGTNSASRRDTLKAMVMYYLTAGNSASQAEIWFEGSYSRYLYPEANMDDRRISEFMEEVGTEQNWRAFFGKYIPLVTDHAEQVNVIIDSTGAPNSCNLDVTAISNHNGIISNEVRLIYVMDRDRNVPIFLRYVAGNINDASTLIRTIRELSHQGVGCSYALLDAGYPTDDNLREMLVSGVDFITRLPENRKLHKELVTKYSQRMQTKSNFVLYNERRLYVKKVRCELSPGFPGYAYCILDVDRKNDEDKKRARKAFKEGLTSEEMYESTLDTGMFILISNMNLKNSDVVGDYYVRQYIEQFLDICKNYTHLLPLRDHKEETLRGHLLISFVAASVMQMLQNDLKENGKVKKQGSEHRVGNRSPNPISALGSLRNQKCKIYDEVALPSEPQAVANSVYNLLGYDVPYGIPLPKRGS